MIFALYGIWEALVWGKIVLWRVRWMFFWEGEMTFLILKFGFVPLVGGFTHEDRL